MGEQNPGLVDGRLQKKRAADCLQLTARRKSAPGRVLSAKLPPRKTRNPRAALRLSRAAVFRKSSPGLSPSNFRKCSTRSSQCSGATSGSLESQAVVVVLWCAATYLHDEFEIFPFLSITAPSKRCGKTTLFTLASKVSPRALVLAGRSSRLRSSFARSTLTRPR